MRVDVRRLKVRLRDKAFLREGRPHAFHNPEPATLSIKPRQELANGHARARFASAQILGDRGQAFFDSHVLSLATLRSSMARAPPCLGSLDNLSYCGALRRVYPTSG